MAKFLTAAQVLQYHEHPETRVIESWEEGLELVLEHCSLHTHSSSFNLSILGETKISLHESGTQLYVKNIADFHAVSAKLDELGFVIRRIDNTHAHIALY